MELEGAWAAQVGTDNKYQYNDIEFNDDLGLNWDMAEFRSYDAIIGRWSQVVPSAEFVPDMTPYRFGFNNPLLYADPLGLFETRKEATPLLDYLLSRTVLQSTVDSQIHLIIKFL